MGYWGMWFERTLTWWEHSAGYNAYVARAQGVLQLSAPVIDGLLWIGEGLPDDSARLRKAAEIAALRQLSGHRLALVNGDALRGPVSVETGGLRLPSGERIQTLVIAPGADVKLESLERLQSAVEAGLTLVGMPPVDIVGRQVERRGADVRERHLLLYRYAEPLGVQIALELEAEVVDVVPVAAHDVAYSFLLDSGPNDALGRPTRSSGVRRLEWFLANTDPAHVWLEMDIFWAHVAQYKHTSFTAADGSTQTDIFDPLALVAAQTKRYPLFHAKDGKVNTATTNGYDMVPFGTGDIDYQTFFANMGAKGYHNPMYEQDNAPGNSTTAPGQSLDYAALSYANMAALRG